MVVAGKVRKQAQYHALSHITMCPYVSSCKPGDMSATTYPIVGMHVYVGQCVVLGVILVCTLCLPLPSLHFSGFYEILYYLLVSFFTCKNPV